MQETLRLHYAPDNASLIVRLALEELALPYEAVLVDRRRAEQTGPQYKAINPAGKIPALETKDGALFETAAILLYLADREGRLAPRQDTTERGVFLSWLFYLSNTMHPNLRMTFYPQSYVGKDGDHSRLLDCARQNLIESLHLMEQLAAKEHDWCAGENPSLLDLYLAGMLRWMALYPQGDTDWFSLREWPNLYFMLKRLETRESVGALIKAEGMQPSPFTDPHYPNPPEGVAL